MTRPLITTLLLALMATGCRPSLLPGPGAVSSDAHTLWSEVRQAHSGGLRLLSMHFTLRLDMPPGATSLMQPEIDEGAASRVGLDFATGQAWQAFHQRRTSFLWWWDGERLQVTRNGRSWRPPPGADRSLLLRALLWLMRPSDAALHDDVEVSTLPPRAGRYRLQFVYRGGYRDRFVLEVDPRSFLVRAIEHSAGEFHVRHRIFRNELEDLRDVGEGVMVPHRITQQVDLPTGRLPFRVLELSNVQVGLESAFPRRSAPQGQPAPHGPEVAPLVIPVAAELR